MTWEQNRLYQYLIAVVEDGDNENCLRRQEKKIVGNRKDSDFFVIHLKEYEWRYNRMFVALIHNQSSQVKDFPKMDLFITKND